MSKSVYNEEEEKAFAKLHFSICSKAVFSIFKLRVNSILTQHFLNRITKCKQFSDDIVSILCDLFKRETKTKKKIQHTKFSEIKSGTKFGLWYSIVLLYYIHNNNFEIKTKREAKKKTHTQKLRHTE